jgi:hypothetical protein
MRDARKIALIEFIADLETLAGDTDIDVISFFDRTEDLRLRLDALCSDIHPDDRPYVDSIHELLLSLSEGPLQRQIDQILDPQDS